MEDVDFQFIVPTKTVFHKEPNVVSLMKINHGYTNVINTQNNETIHFCEGC